MKDWSFSRFLDCVTILIGATTLRQVGEASYELYFNVLLEKVWNDCDLSMRPTKVTKWKHVRNNLSCELIQLSVYFFLVYKQCLFYFLSQNNTKWQKNFFKKETKEITAKKFKKKTFSRIQKRIKRKSNRYYNNIDSTQPESSIV